jgi:hypothetical protein
LKGQYKNDAKKKVRKSSKNDSTRLRDIDVVGMRRNGDRSEGRMGKIGRFGIFWERQMDGGRCLRTLE